MIHGCLCAGWYTASPILNRAIAGVDDGSRIEHGRPGRGFDKSSQSCALRYGRARD